MPVCWRRGERLETTAGAERSLERRDETRAVIVFAGRREQKELTHKPLRKSPEVAEKRIPHARKRKYAVFLRIRLSKEIAAIPSIRASRDD
jgi:hypothetical protein